jgi:Protein of unknown function with PCYCGC motif
MKKTTSLILLIPLLLSLFGAACERRLQESSAQQPSPQASPKTSVAKIEAVVSQKPLPAFQSAESAKNLKLTLSPDMFTGTVRAAYAAVREIPETIAQLPCFCRCDRSVGHKSLHSCFEDDHGAKCGICMNSALKAYKLQKEQKLAPEKIREQLIAEYAGY